MCSNVYEVQQEYSQGTAGIHSGYSQGTVRVQQGYSQGTAGIQWGIVGTSRGTVVLVVCSGVCGGGGGGDAGGGGGVWCAYSVLVKRTYTNISGQCISIWSEREMWSLANLTLNVNLPIDLIEILHISKTGKGNDSLQLSGARYFKVMPDGKNNFTTR